MKLIRLAQPTLLLRIIIAIMLLSHGIPGMLNGGVMDFGKLYLNEIGFAPYGVALAWTIKISHVICAILLIVDKYIFPACLFTIAIMVAGIILIHFNEGWFVVGGGRNGMEYNVLIIFVLLQIMVNSWNKKNKVQYSIAKK